MKKTKPAKDIDEYISRFSDDVQAILIKVRSTISKAAPDAKEVISYQDARLQAARHSGLLRRLETAHWALPADLW